MIFWSHEARVLVRPFATYAVAGEERRALRLRLVRGPVALLLLVGCFVSFTTAGRLLLDHVVLDAFAWAFAPAFQALAAVLAARTVRSKVGVVELVDLYFLGHAPWKCLMIAIAAVCVLAEENAWPAMRTLLESNALFAAFIATFAAGVLSTIAFFARGAALTKGRAAIAALLFYLLYGGAILVYFASTGQLDFLLYPRRVTG